MDEINQDAQENETSVQNSEFKKPVLIRRTGKVPKKLNEKTSEEIESQKPVDRPPEPPPTKDLPLKDTSESVPYKEPKWSGLCPDGSDYGLEVLKSGMIVENVNLTKKPYYVFGRLPICDVILAHPTISRYHAILQYKAFAEDDEPPCGWYLYDLSSTHGTFLNKERVKSGHYTRVRVGHQIKFGNSTRTYIMLGPDFDSEGESDLTVTDIKQRADIMKLEREIKIKEAFEQREKERLEEERKREEQGIDWGLGEDAEEETDLSENPYAMAANEELYLDDPKKTLRGYFEREGHELTYDCEERGVGQFICRVELPMDDARGRPVVAEVIHKGKKKETVVACALEACRILDRAGLLRQSTHESRKRKKRDWSADDYYDSDEDPFLDRTGSVERKRKLRMEKHGVVERTAEENKALTHDDLLKQIAEIESRISSEEKRLEGLRAPSKVKKETDGEVDALDEYMSSLGKQSMAQKAEISKAKMSIQKLKAELSKVQRLADIARPAHLPPLVKRDETKMAVKMGSNSVVYGKRIRLKEDIEKRPKVRQPHVQKVDEEFEEEVDSDEEISKKSAVEENLVKQNSRKSKSLEEDNENVENQDLIDEKCKEIDKTKDRGDADKVEEEVKKMYGPIRPPENYVVPEGYFDQETDRDLPEIMEEEGQG